MFWTVHSYPPCTHHVFLSHCREDHDPLIRPAYDRLRAAGAEVWLDREDYHYGRDSRGALRDAVLRSRHVVFFVTRAMLSTGRGWCVLELAYAELLQATLTRTGGPLANVLLPLFFVPQTDADLPRSVWQLARDRGRFHDPAADADPAAWAAAEIARFLRDEQALAKDIAALARKDAAFRAELRGRPGLLERATRFDPGPIPLPESVPGSA